MENKKLSLQDIKKISLEILLDVVNFCDINKITYYLACGTLLGCVKYGGYIPWDDDVDIMMPRPDYERFLSLYKGKYSLLHPSEGVFFYAKVCDNSTKVVEKGIDYKKNKYFGVNIDIFPIDGTSKHMRIARYLTKKSKFLETLLRLSNQPIFYRKNPLKAFNRIIPRIIGSKRLVMLIERNCKKYKYNNSEYVVRYKSTSNGVNKPLKKTIYEVDRKVFDGYVFNVPKGYDVWLKSFYGEDYMEYTPDVSRQKTHDIEAYYI